MRTKINYSDILYNTEFSTVEEEEQYYAMAAEYWEALADEQYKQSQSQSQQKSEELP